MIGYLNTSSGRAALDEDLVWSHPVPVVEQYLNTVYSVDSSEAGNHHRPPGCATLERAAAALTPGVPPVVLVAPYPPLPPEVVS